jgi:hypothetical protein
MMEMVGMRVRTVPVGDGCISWYLPSRVRTVKAEMIEVVEITGIFLESAVRTVQAELKLIVGV